MRRLSNQPNQIIVHHTGGTDANPLADTSHHTYSIINEAHRIRFNYPASNGTYVGYHYVIEKSGKVVPATPENEEGVHTKGQNLNSIGICLAGNFDNTLPTEAQKTALVGLLGRLRRKYGSIPAYPHRKYVSKTCYGNKLSDNWAETLLVVSDEEIKKLQMKLIELSKVAISLLQTLLRLKK